MKKIVSKYVFVFIAISFLLGGIFVSFLITQSTNQIAQGDKLFYEGQLSQALIKYQLAQKVWPFLHHNEQLNTRVKDIISMKETLKNRPTLTAFLKESISNKDVDSLIQELKNKSGVKEVKYVSKDDAYKIYSELNKDNPELVKMVDKNILPASIDIYLSDQSIEEKIVKFVKSSKIIEEVSVLPTL